jgi:hypothetical protein
MASSGKTYMENDVKISMAVSDNEAGNKQLHTRTA